MRVMEIDIWDAYAQGHTCCVTINGYVRKDGCAVMGRGVAKQATKRFPGLAYRLGTQLADERIGNHVQFIAPRLLGFPVKPAQGTSTGDNIVAHMAGQFPKGTTVPGWAMKADVAIIERSLLELDIMRGAYGWGDVYLPRPGCGAGELEWVRNVMPLCSWYEDWLIVVTLPTKRRTHRL